MSTLVERAFTLALDLHREQCRKASIVPNAAYMSHLMEVAGMVWGCFAVDDPTAEVVVAADLLHDAIEDQPEQSPWNRIVVECGPEVLNLVESLTEQGTGDPDGKKAPWLERKQSYVSHISEMSTHALLISVCDKLQSIRELKRQVRRIGVEDQAYARLGIGETLEERKQSFLRFHLELMQAYRMRLAEIAYEIVDPIIDAILALIDDFDEVVVWLCNRQS